MKPKQADDTTITYQHEGKTYAVSEHVASFKYEALESKISGQNSNENEVPDEMPESPSKDFMEAETKDGKTVNEAFYDKMEEEWGDLEMSDKRRQYFELLQARSALMNGYPYLPNSVYPGSNGDEMHKGNGKVLMAEANLYGLLDEEAIAEKLTELSADDDITKGVDKLMEDVSENIKDKNGLVNKMYKTMTSDEYKEKLDGMDAAEAAAIVDNDIQGLEFLDPAKAKKVREETGVVSGGELGGLLDNLKDVKITEENLAPFVKDSVYNALKAIGITFSGMGFADKAVMAYLDSRGKEGGDALTKKQRAQADGFLKVHKMLSESITKGVAKGLDGAELEKYVAEKTRNQMHAASRNSRAAGHIWRRAMGSGFIRAIGNSGHVGALVALAVNSSNAPGEPTEEDRMALVKDVFKVFATANDVSKLEASRIGELINKPGMALMLGLEGSNTKVSDAFKKAFPKMYDKPVPDEAFNRYLQSITAGLGDGDDGGGGSRIYQIPSLNEDISVDEWADDLKKEIKEYEEGRPRDGQPPADTLSDAEKRNAKQTADYVKFLRDTDELPPGAPKKLQQMDDIKNLMYALHEGKDIPFHVDIDRVAEQANTLEDFLRDYKPKDSDTSEFAQRARDFRSDMQYTGGNADMDYDTSKMYDALRKDNKALEKKSNRVQAELEKKINGYTPWN